MGLLRAILDAIHGEDEKIGGQALSRLTVPLTPTAVSMTIETTYGFGEYNDGVGDGRVLVNGEVINFTARTPVNFTGLTRGVLASTPRLSPASTLVYDLSGNRSAIDLVRRGLLVDFAIGTDLDVIARNLGLAKCPGLTDAQWRAVIKATAYLAKQPMDAFRQALDALVGVGGYTLREDVISEPWKVFVAVAIILATSLRGRFVLNGGEPAVANGAGTTVTVANTILHVLGVFDDTPVTRRGERLGLTNYLNPGGTFLGSVITLGTPTAAAAPVIVDYGAWKAHYLAPSEVVLDDADFYAYLADPLLTARCLVDHVRAAGIRVEVGALL